MHLVDAHIHVDRLDDPQGFARQALADGVGLFSSTLVPEEFIRVRQLLGDFPNVRVGVGLHPWWVSEDAAKAQEQARKAVVALHEWSYVGEVGLDAAASHQTTFGNQLLAFDTIMRACAEEGGKVISIHCVRAYDQLFDILQKTGVTDSCTCILHWFSGTHDNLLEAIGLGCWFSVGKRMLDTKRGRAYVQAMPIDRLLLETDAPPVEQGVNEAADMLKEVLGSGSIVKTADNAKGLFGFI